ncbi:DNA topoisomerase VI subunit B [Salarchaeum sp. III]
MFGKLLYGSRFHAREQSLTPGQKILVRRKGDLEFVPIGVLCDAYLPREGGATAAIPDDIEAPSFNRETHEMSWEPVTHAIRHETDEKTYEITTEKGRTVEVTGNHSVFSVTKDGDTEEVKAGNLEPGDTILTPRKLPSFGDCDSVNILEHLTRDELEDRRVYVYGFDTERLEELRAGERVRKKPSADSERKRTYYRVDGVDILKDSLEQNYIEKGYLPAETVIDLGWEEKAAEQNCELKTYQVGGGETTLPVSVPLSAEFMNLVGYYVAEGHAGPRQVGFTFGSHEAELIQETERAVAGLGGNTTTVERERNSTRVKAFGSPLALFLKNVCGDAAENKRIPAFVFEAAPEYQQKFIAALYQGDGSEAHPSNELSHTTTSETLSRQLSVLWNMQGVLASTEVVDENGGYADEPNTAYRTKVYGEDVNPSDVFSEDTVSGEQQYKRIPTALLDDVRAESVNQDTVPDSVPGLLMGAGVGSNIEHAAVYQSLIEDALNGKYVEKPRYVHNLKEKGLLTEEHEPTATLQELWETVQNLHGLTDTDMCLLPVKSVEETESPEYVYDISVPGATGTDENFVVANEGAISVKNSRGQQGIGISAAVLYSQLTSGTPAKITSRTKGSETAKYFELTIDTDSNEPVIQDEAETTWERSQGTRIELEMEANMRARSQLHDYMQHTAVVNPHARLELREPNDHFKYERAEGATLPAETEEIRPHPHGVELGALIKMLNATDSHSIRGFLQEEFTRVGAKTADSILDAFRDRHYGREMRWSVAAAKSSRDEGGEAAGANGLRDAVTEAVSNKSSADTDAFADALSEELAEFDRVSFTDIENAVAAAADEASEETGTTFGDTVRENVVDAVWAAVTANRDDDLYGFVDDATSVQKDDATVAGLARRIGEKFGDDTPRDRLVRGDLRQFVVRAAETTEEVDDATVGETSRENITERLWEAMGRVEDDVPLAREVASSRDAARDLLDAMTSVDVIAPPTNCLAPITPELIEAGLRKEVDADFYAAATRDADVHGGDPFVVEAGIAYGGDIPADGTVDLMRFANRVPLVYQRGACATTQTLKGIGWRNYGLDQPGGSGLPSGPCVIMVHVASTNVPFTSESKDALASVPAIEDEIELAVREAARDLKSYLNKKRSMQKRREKQNVIADILPKMASKVSEMTDREELLVEDSLARIMNNVLVESAVEDGTLTVTVENHADANADLDVTAIVDAEPTDLSAGSVVEMDGEYFLTWEPTVSGGDDAELTANVPDGTECDLSVDGIQAEKLTINQ